MQQLDPVIGITILLAAALVGGMIAHRLRQPVILGYLVVGMIVGPHSLGLVADLELIEATATIGGSKQSGARVKGWTAEVFTPYELLKPLQNVPPKPGTRWRANFYRVDYDDGKSTSWDWTRVGPSFHEFKNYGTLVFE